MQGLCTLHPHQPLKRLDLNFTFSTVYPRSKTLREFFISPAWQFVQKEKNSPKNGTNSGCNRNPKRI